MLFLYSVLLGLCVTAEQDLVRDMSVAKMEDKAAAAGESPEFLVSITTVFSHFVAGMRVVAHLERPACGRSFPGVTP